MENNKINKVDEYIVKCEVAYNDYDDLSKKELIDEIITVFQHSIIDLTHGLSVYQKHKTINLNRDLKKISSRLTWFSDVLRDNEENKNSGMLDKNGNISISNSNVDGSTIYLFFKDIRDEIRQIESELDMEESLRLLDKVEEIYNTANHLKETWKLLKSIVVEVSTQKITVAAPILKTISVIINMES